VALVLTSTGDGLLAAVLLGVCTGDPLPGTVAVAAVLGGLARFGTTSLPALAGAQAVLGPAVAVGPAVGALASGLAGLALVVVAPSAWRDWRGWAFGLLAGLVAIGPAASSLADGLVRAAGAVVGVGLVVVGQRWWPAADRPWWFPWLALALSGAALALAVAA
jgi:hypothetical protein